VEHPIKVLLYASGPPPTCALASATISLKGRPSPNVLKM